MSTRRLLQINTQERAVSTDINRLQKFGARDSDELLRFMLSGQSGDELGPGTLVYPSAIGAPLAAEVIGGLMVRPSAGSFEVLVDAGLLMAFAPDGASEESDYKYARSTGVGAGVLAITPNASGSIRIDVVECRINPTPATVTDNRDIFDPTTGLFTASVVTKESASQLEFRVRAGVGGAGYPAPDVGWLPLAVASVPNGAASNDAVTFWDVRPLLQDRVRTARQGFPAASVDRPHLHELDARLDRQGAAQALVSGFWSATLRGRALGGGFRRGTPGTEFSTWNAADVANQAAAIAEPISAPVYVYACTPKGLPRWTMYAPFPGARIPRTPVGMLIASMIAPDLFGTPSVSIPIPASTGLVGSVDPAEAVCVLVIPNTSVNQFGVFHATNRILRTNSFGPGIISAAGPSYDFAITNTMWPPNVKAIYAQITGQITNIDPTRTVIVVPQVEVYAGPTAAGPYATLIGSTFTVMNGGVIAADVLYTAVYRLPIPVTFPDAPPTSPRNIRLVPNASELHGNAFTQAATATMNIWGYEF